MLDFISTNLVTILVILLAVSEGLALIPAIKSNSVFTLIVNVLKFLKEKVTPPPASKA